MEARRFSGGRVFAFPDVATDLALSNGRHFFFVFRLASLLRLLPSFPLFPHLPPSCKLRTRYGVVRAGLAYGKKCGTEAFGGQQIHS